MLRGLEDVRDLLVPILQKCGFIFILWSNISGRGSIAADSGELDTQTSTSPFVQSLQVKQLLPFKDVSGITLKDRIDSAHLKEMKVLELEEPYEKASI